MFDDSFVLAFLSFILVTEWYLAAVIGMSDHAGSKVKVANQLEYQPIGNSMESVSAQTSFAFGNCRILNVLLLTLADNL